MAEAIVDRPDLRVARLPADARLVLHGAPEDASTLAVAGELSLPTAMLTAETGGGWTALHLAPDEWLLIGPFDGAAALIERFAGCGTPHSLVDVGERSLALDVSGSTATTLLAAGCPLDLDGVAFQVNACSRSLLGKVTVTLWRTGPLAWRLEYGRSFDDYVVGLLSLAAQDAPEAVWAT